MKINVMRRKTYTLEPTTWDSVNTPIFLSSTYKLTEERYAGWAAGAQHTLLYSRISSVNSDAIAQKICAMEGGKTLKPLQAVWLQYHQH